MASIIRVKRSTGTTAPGSLQFGELGLTIGTGTQANKGERLFVGDNSGNVDVVGGRYFTDLMVHAPGTVASVTNPTTAANGFVAILDQNRKVDVWNVDNLTLDGNTFSSTNTNGDINIDPNGSGEIVIPDDTFLTFGTGKDSKIEYDENGTDQLNITGADVRINITTQSNSKDTGALIVEGGVGIEKNLNVGGNLNLEGGAVIDDIKIQDNVISSLSASSDTLFLDPYPDGLSNEGTVIIKGSLQVDGTTTSINSTTSTLNDPIFHIGDLTSERTVMTTVISGVSTIRLDSIVGINTGDIVSGSASLNVGAANTISSYDSTSKVITLQDATISGIATAVQLTITHAFDTNTDRGISFAYNDSQSQVGGGTTGNKTGFFGYIDQGSVGSAATHRSWTYIPEATIGNSLVSGTRGYLDIKGIYYQTGDFNQNGMIFFDVDGLQTSTNAPSSSVSASKQVMTAITKRILNLPSNVTLAEGDIVRQDTSDAYGVVESAVSGGATVPLIGVEGTFNATNNLRREGQNGFIADLSVVPSSVGVIYTDKPHWTNTLDGGTF